jgi:hypothetical protein
VPGLRPSVPHSVAAYWLSFTTSWHINERIDSLQLQPRALKSRAPAPPSSLWGPFVTHRTPFGAQATFSLMGHSSSESFLISSTTVLAQANIMNFKAFGPATRTCDYGLFEIASPRNLQSTAPTGIARGSYSYHIDEAAERARQQQDQGFSIDGSFLNHCPIVELSIDRDSPSDNATAEDRRWE